MTAPQVLAIILMTLSVGYHLAKHNQQRFDKFNFWGKLAHTIVWSTILYFGGFWN